MMLGIKAFMFFPLVLVFFSALFYPFDLRKRKVLSCFSFLTLSLVCYVLLGDLSKLNLRLLEFLWLAKSIAAVFFVSKALSIRPRMRFALFVAPLILSLFKFDNALIYSTMVCYFSVFVLCEIANKRDEKGGVSFVNFLLLFSLFDFSCVTSAALGLFSNEFFFDARYFFLSFFLFCFSVSEKKNIKSLLNPNLKESLVFFSGLYLFSMSAIAYLVDLVPGRQLALVNTISCLAILFPLLAIFNVRAVFRKFYNGFSKVFIGSAIDYIKLNERVSNALVSKSKDPAAEALAILMELTQSVSVCVVDARSKSNTPVFWFGDDEKLPDAQVLELLALKGFFEELRWIVDANRLQNSPADYSGSKFEMGYRWKKGWVIAPVFFEKEVCYFFILKTSESIDIGRDWKVRDTINFIAKQVAVYLESSSKAKVSIEHEQLIGFYQTSAFVVHDLKNVSAQLDMITDNASKYRDDPDFVDDTFSTINSMSKRLSKVLSQLRSKLDFERAAGVSVNDWWSLITDKARTKKVSIQKKGDIYLLEFFPLLMRGVGHLIDNAIEACQGALIPVVTVTFKREEEKCLIEVLDNGEGMSDEFLKTKLFKPFITTKGNKGMGLGVFEVKELVSKEGGEVYVESKQGEGTLFRISLPFVKKNDTVG